MYQHPNFSPNLLSIASFWYNKILIKIHSYCLRFLFQTVTYSQHQRRSGFRNYYKQHYNPHQFKSFQYSYEYILVNPMQKFSFQETSFFPHFVHTMISLGLYSDEQQCRQASVFLIGVRYYLLKYIGIAYCSSNYMLSFHIQTSPI